MLAVVLLARRRDAAVTGNGFGGDLWGRHVCQVEYTLVGTARAGRGACVRCRFVGGWRLHPICHAEHPRGGAEDLS